MLKPDNSFAFSKIVGEKIVSLLQPKCPQALVFLAKFAEYAHLMDDIVDEAEYKNPEQLFKLQALALEVYSCDFYQALAPKLAPIIMQIHNTYADSVKWEHEATLWKQKFADALRCCGNELVFAIIYHFCGYDAMREVSLLIREDAYLRHHNVKGESI